MTSEPVHSWTADADLCLPADGLTLLGEYQGGGYAGRSFLIGRGDGQVIQLPLLLYLIMAAIAEGGVDGGWSADQVSARVGAASGQGLSSDNVRYLIAGKLAPLGLIKADGADRPDEAPGAARRPRVNQLPRLKIRGLPQRHRTGEAPTGGQLLSWPLLGRVQPLLLRYRRRRWALALGGTAVLVSVAAAAPMRAVTGNRETGGARSASASASAAQAGRSQAAEASWPRAAAWVAQQVSPDVTVSCDPGMCRQLQRDGFPAARLQPLPRGARGPLSSGMVVATQAIRSQLGIRLAAAYAPQVIASFGSGVARVDVRMIAPDGAAAYRTQLAAEVTVLASVGRQLLGNKNVQSSPSAQAALRAGQVDARLLAILALLSAQMPVRLVGFTGAPGAGPGTPLRAAEISVSSPASSSAVLALLNAQQSPYRPATATATATAGAGGGGGRGSVIALRYDAPASLTMSQP
jgi:hypothetical protein